MSAEILDARLNARLSRRVKEDLAGLARRRHVDESELARMLLDEGLRRVRHPGIVFRDTPTGREAAIEGRRLYVWQVMETVWASDGDTAEAAEYLSLRPDQVDTAAGYYADHGPEIVQLIALNQDEASRGKDQSDRRKRVQRR